MLPPFFELYKTLIAIPSISSTDPAWDQSNEPLIDQLCDWFERLGFKAHKQAIPDHPGKFNMIAQLGQGSGGLMLSGHSDTVPFDAGRWQHDPFKLTEADNRWYGLGSIDMKGYFAFILDACRNLLETDLQKPLYVVATADEETSMVGAQYLAEASKRAGEPQLQPDMAIIGEPTNLQPIIAHKGHLSYGIRIQGKSGHSSQPHLGQNAIEMMSEVLPAVLHLQQRLADNFSSPLFDVPFPTLNLGQLQGGDSPNRICGCCTLGFDVRPTPELSLIELAPLLEQTLQPFMQRWPNALELISYHEPIPPYQTRPDTELVKTLEDLGQRQCGSVNYCTEAPYLQEIGCETVVFGVGSIEQAHQPNEYLSLNSIKPAQQAVRSLIERYCLK